MLAVESCSYDLPFSVSPSWLASVTNISIKLITSIEIHQEKQERSPAYPCEEGKRDVIPDSTVTKRIIRVIMNNFIPKNSMSDMKQKKPLEKKVKTDLRN